MKNTENLYPGLMEINHEELSRINGGSFAYDLGRFLRYLGVYAANGTGGMGTTAANFDFILNSIQNGE